MPSQAFIDCMVSRIEAQIANQRREVYSPMVARHGFDAVARAVVIVAQKQWTGPDDALRALRAELGG
jgi:hypothetical protein